MESSAEVELMWAAGQCEQDGDSLVCGLGDLGSGRSVRIDLAVQVPVEITRTLVSQGTVRAPAFDPDSDNNLYTLSTTVRPYSLDAELVCDGPNLLANGGFEEGFQSNGVAKAWFAFDNGGEVTYSYRDERWGPVVSEGKLSQLIKIDTIDLRRPSEPGRIAGIYQTVRLTPGFTYELSVEALMRERNAQPMEDRYRYMVGWGTSGDGGTDPAGMEFRAWLPLRAIYPMSQPGKMQPYRARFEASSEEMTLWLFGLKKWATLGRDLNVNLDGAALRICRPVTTVDRPPR